MSLTQDDRALLQLVLVRGKSYSDIAELLGTDTASIRQRAHAALARLEDLRPEEVGPLADWILGQERDPDAVQAALSSDPGLAEAASPIRQQLILLAPDAKIPEVPLPQAPPRGSSPARGPAQEPATSRGIGGKLGQIDPGRRTILAGLVLATALAVVVGVVLLLGSGSGDGDGEETGKPEVTTAVLSAVEGESGEGKLDFGFSGVDFASNVRITGLAPSRPGQSYAIWLDGPIGSFPIQQSRVGESGEISGQIAINQAIICFIAADFFTDVSLSRTPNQQLARAIREARRASGGRGDFPSYTGTRVLEGKILMPAESKERISRLCSAQGS